MAPVQHVPILSFRFALRCTLCLVLTAFNLGVIAYAGNPLYQVTAGHPLQVFGVSMLFVALLGSLVKVWIVALRSYNRHF